jgi:hypothetical protein
MKKNHSIWVTIGKIIELFKDIRWLCMVFIIFMMVFKVSCGTECGKPKFSIGCQPIHLSEVKEVIQ